MPITIKTALKAAQKPSTVSGEVSDFASPIDTLGKLLAEQEKAEAALIAKAKKEMDALTLIQQKVAEATKELANDLNEYLDGLGVDPDKKGHVEKGLKFQVELSAKGNSRTITDMAGIKKLMDAQDPDLFMKLVKMDLKSVDSYLTAPERETVLKTTRTNRTFKVGKKV